MKIDFDGIQGFVAVAELQGFGKAAGHLNITQTALTRRIQKLEAYLAARLFDRTTRSVRLTAVGRDFLPQARRLVDELTFAVGHLKDKSRLGLGHVTIASIPTMAHHTLPEVIRAYAQRHPGNRIRIIESNAADVYRAVLREEAEFGITIDLERHADLAVQPVLREPFMFFCRREHRLGRHKSVQWRALAATELIMVSGLSGNRVLLDSQLARQRLNVQGNYEVEHLSTALALVAAGVGTAILPRSAFQAGAYPDVQNIPLVEPVVSRTLVLIRRRQATLSPASQVFHDLLAASLARRTGSAISK